MEQLGKGKGTAEEERVVSGRFGKRNKCQPLQDSTLGEEGAKPTRFARQELKRFFKEVGINGDQEEKRGAQ